MEEIKGKDYESLIKEICSREVSGALYDITYDGISVYNFIRRSVRIRIMKFHGFGINERTPLVPKVEYQRSVLISLWHFFKLFLLRKKYDNIVYSFERIDMINGEYVDKFTDPLIDYTNISKSFVILEPGRGGRHFSPRKHGNQIVYTDLIDSIAFHSVRFCKNKFKKKFANIVESLRNSINQQFPEISMDDEWLLNWLIIYHTKMKCYEFLFKKTGAKNFFAPSRTTFNHITPAAKKNSVKVFELQHGFIKNYSLTYSGFKTPLFTPDYFLAYGEQSVTDNYGIDTNKIIVIGWAFDIYLQQQEPETGDVEKSNTLMIADPLDTEKEVNTCILLARNYPSINFYYRAHPGEVLENKYKVKLTNERNIYLDDNSQNILVTLKRFTHVIGVNSTVLNEALSLGKKVGILHLEGLCPFNVDGSEDNYFWKIDTIEAFRRYIDASPSEKKQRIIYSKFDKSLFEKLLKK